MFTFEVQEESVSRDIEMGLMIQNYWIMHEYTLDYDDPNTTCAGFGICKLMVDDFKKVKIAPKFRRKKKKTASQPFLCSAGGRSRHVHDDDINVAGAMAGSNIEAATKKEVSEKIHNENNEYHSRSKKRMRCVVGIQADEEGNNPPQRRKKMPPLELAEDLHHDRHQPTTITDDDGNGLLTLVQEESTTNFGVDRFLNPVMWPANEPDDQFTLPPDEEERRLQEEANQALSCAVVPHNLDSWAPPPPDAALLQQPTSTSK